MDIPHDRDLRKAQMQAETLLLHPEKFELFSVDVVWNGEQCTRVVSLHNGVWMCSCHPSQEPCGHMLAAQELLASVFQLAMSEPVTKDG